MRVEYSHFKRKFSEHQGYSPFDTGVVSIEGGSI